VVDILSRHPAHIPFLRRVASLMQVKNRDNTTAMRIARDLISGFVLIDCNEKRIRTWIFN
jgi:hypothetical protein